MPMSLQVALLASIVVAAAAVATVERADDPFVRRNVNPLTSTVDVLLNIPPRYMWGWGDSDLSGYCGETSFQSNGIFWGEWVSSEKVRDTIGGAELLIAVNDEKAAKALKFDYDSWNYRQTTPQYSNFISWIQTHIDAGHMVAIGMYEKLVNSDTDPDYDHIVPIIGYQYDTSNNNKVVGLYYNDLWLNSTRVLAVPAQVTSRKNCLATSTPSQPYGNCLPQEYDYGIAFMGNVDTNSETFRTMLTMPSWTEPDYGKEDKLNQKPVEFTVSATISGLTPGTTYTVLRFDSYSTLPTRNFISGPYVKKWTISPLAPTHTLKNFDTFLSNLTVFYRTVIAP